MAGVRMRQTVMARIRPAQYQPDRGRPVGSLDDAARWLGVSASTVRRAISRAGFEGRIAGPSVAGMIELWADYGDSAGFSVFVSYHDSTTHLPTQEQLAR